MTSLRPLKNILCVDLFDGLAITRKITLPGHRCAPLTSPPGESGRDRSGGLTLLWDDSFFFSIGEGRWQRRCDLGKERK
jgi:hypothetical protein